MTEDLFGVHGFGFSVRTNCRAAREAFSRLYSEFRIPEPSAPVEALLESRRNRVSWRLGQRSASASNLKGALWGLEAVLCEAIVRSQQRMIAIHAAMLYSDRSVILLAGPSNAGKSTLSLALSRRGISVATDDMVLADPQSLAVWPIPRCFHLDDRSVELLQSDGMALPQTWKCSSFMVPSDLSAVPNVPRPPAILVYLALPRGEQPQLRPIPQSEMAARLLRETGQGPFSDAEVIRLVTRLSGGASCFTLMPGPLSETADVVADMILESDSKRSFRTALTGESQYRTDRDVYPHSSC